MDNSQPMFIQFKQYMKNRLEAEKIMYEYSGKGNIFIVKYGLLYFGCL